MAKIMIVLRMEIYALISRRSFWFGVLGVPAIAFLIYSGIAWINRTQGGSTAPDIGIGRILEQPVDDRPQGYVDQAGLITQYPYDFSARSLIDYANEPMARLALEAGTISAYYVLAPDFIDTGELKVYTQEFNFISSQDKADDLRRLIEFNLLNGNLQLEKAIASPLSGLEKTN
ncbi:MAG: hypothetical protein IH586_12495, partial [Anaerolineaceae bacterium]|nr:hypothetical protein [Anaerolineaceae bacterium]